MRSRQEGRLAFPAIAANDARCKHMFDNPYGTGQTTLTALLALTNVLAAGREFCIVGYGWVGKGVARAADGLGGRVTVVEIDPVRALTAHMDGFRVAALADALPDADVVITATGLDEASSAPKRCRCSRTACCSRTPAITTARSTCRRCGVRPTRSIDARAEACAPTSLGGRRVHVLVDGALVNIAGLDGNPIEIMDLSFSVQALSIAPPRVRQRAAPA